LYLDGDKEGAYEIGQGGVRTVFVSGSTASAFSLTAENSVHMFWIIPQYMIITTGEIMFSITGLEFSYSQSPESMKSVLQAAWLLTVAFGNFIVIIIAKMNPFEDQASEFFMFATLMFLDVLVLCVLAYNYTYVDFTKRKQEKDEDEVVCHSLN